MPIDCLVPLQITESLVAAHRRAKAYGNVALTRAIEHALLHAGTELAAASLDPTQRRFAARLREVLDRPGGTDLAGTHLSVT